MSQDFTKWLSTRTGGSLPLDTSKVRAVAEGANPIGLTQYPVMKTDIRFATGKFRTSKGLPMKLRGTLPETWVNYKGPDQRYELTTRPTNQGTCGSCYAVSTVQCVDDSFVFQGLSFNPKLSPMSVLACQQGNAKCGGGNPSLVIDQIAAKGCYTSNCVDYFSICQASDTCSGKKPVDDQANNSLIPDSCGCCNPLNDNLRYFVKNKVLAYNSCDDPRNTDVDVDAVNKIKGHLMLYGAAVTGFLVGKNFVGARTTDAKGLFGMTDGVYVETENYSGDTRDIPSDNLNSYVGGHAVAIVGWGVAKNVRIPSARVVMDLPYWMVRNSWGIGWGQGGYFKMAMYQPATRTTPEINQRTAFERFHTEFGGIGGILMFESDRVEDFNDTGTNARCAVQDSAKSDPKPVYRDNTPGKNKPSGGDSSSGDGELITFQFTKKTWNRLLIIFVLLIVVYIGWRYYRDNISDIGQPPSITFA